MLYNSECNETVQRFLLTQISLRYRLHQLGTTYFKSDKNRLKLLIYPTLSGLSEDNYIHVKITPFSWNCPDKAITPYTFYPAKQSAQVKTWPSLDFYEIRPNLSCKQTSSMCSALHIKLETSLTSSCASSALPFMFSLEKISRHWIAKVVLGDQITRLSRTTLKTRPGKVKIFFSCWNFETGPSKTGGGKRFGVWWNWKVNACLLAAHYLIRVANLARLFECKEYVAMELCAFRRSGPNILQLHFSFTDVTTRDVYNKPVVPFSELGVVTTGCVRICNHTKQGYHMIVGGVLRKMSPSCLSWPWYSSIRQSVLFPLLPG